MAEVEKFRQPKASSSSFEEERREQGEVLAFLRSELEKYLDRNQQLSLNSLSKRCSISEPTLRRIYKGKIKTVPNVTTIFNLLSYLYGTDDVKILLTLVPSSVSDFFNQKMGFLDELNQATYSDDLTESLSDPVKYLIFKIASNDAGITETKLLDLFGQHGKKQVMSLINEGLIELKDGVYYGLKGNFLLSNDVFVDHFKAVADFIKPHKHAQANPKYSPIFSNFSVSLNKTAYSKIVNLQRRTNKKIVEMMKSEESKGEIPAFFLNAIDTLDEKIADEF